MNIFTKTAVALAVVTSVGVAGQAHAQQQINLTVQEMTSDSFLYTYNVTPTFDTKQVTFSFADINNVSFVSSSNTPLTVERTPAPGLFDFTDGTSLLTSGSTGTYVFRSSDAPTGFVQITSNGSGPGLASNVTGPGLSAAPVPEASTVISTGLLLLLGLGSLAVTARKKTRLAA